MISSRDFDFYEEFAIDTKELGCLMLRVDTPLSRNYEIPEEEGINLPDMPWAKGVLKDWHVTLRYGFLPYVRKEHVRQVMAKITTPTSLSIKAIEVFDNEDYEVVVATVHTGDLRHVFDALGLLPNVSTFVPYNPHITIGYFPRGWYDENNDRIAVKWLVNTFNLDYGDMEE